MCATCHQEATRSVYGLPYCERHGEECEVQAKAVLYDDARYGLERVEVMLEGVWPMLENPLAKAILAEALKAALERASHGSQERFAASGRITGGTLQGPVPGIERGEITPEEYSELDEDHYRVHWLMQRAHLNVGTERALYGLDEERAGIVIAFQEAHDYSPD